MINANGQKILFMPGLSRETLIINLSGHFVRKEFIRLERGDVVMIPSDYPNKDGFIIRTVVKADYQYSQLLDENFFTAFFDEGHHNLISTLTYKDKTILVFEED